MTADTPASRALARAAHLLARLRPARLDLSLPGGWTALVLASLSFLPSLVPRPALYQGLITGLTAAIGYGLGVLGAWVWRELADREPRHPSPRSVRALLVTAPLLLLAALVLGVAWQRESSLLLEMEPEHPAAALVTLPVAALVLAVTIVAARLLRAAADRLAAALRRVIRPRAARLVGVVALVTTVALLVNGVLLEQARVGVNAAFSLTNGGTPEGLGAPTSPLRSGSPASLIDWDTLGFQGRGFVGQGPNAAGIARAAAANGLPAGTTLDPIRVYAGLDSAPDTEARATLAVQDLERAGGFERSSLLVVTTTGTGWVEPTSVSAFEHLTLGDSATVSMQYSFLPSPMSFLADQENARNAGRALFDAVYERWRLLPEDSRPRLYVFGESLGSYGGEAAFSGEFDMANRVSGAVFTGPPGFNHLFGQVVREREDESLQIAPTYRQGRTVRVTQEPFAASEPVGRPWEGTRVLYMVHPSDGTTWWSPDMALSRPDWLAEPRGSDVLPQVRWVPIVSFWQVTADMALSMGPGPGYGHNFAGEHVGAWAQVLGLEVIPGRGSPVHHAVLTASEEEFRP